MKKLAAVFLCFILCTVTVSAEEPGGAGAAGEKITLTQLLGVSREDAGSVAVTITMYDTGSETVSVDKDAFYDISDNFVLVPISGSEPEPLTWQGIYIAVEKADGGISYAYIEQWGFADRYGISMGGVPYALYKAEDHLKTNELIALGKPKITVNEELDVTINGRKAEFALKPFIDENGRTLVPAREFCGLIHKCIIWQEGPAGIAVPPHSNTELEAGGDLSDSIIFRIGEKNYEINGKLREMDTAAQLVDGNAYVPLRVLAEVLGYNVEYITH